MYTNAWTDFVTHIMPAFVTVLLSDKITIATMVEVTISVRTYDKEISKGQNPDHAHSLRFIIYKLVNYHNSFHFSSRAPMSLFDMTRH